MIHFSPGMIFMLLHLLQNLRFFELQQISILKAQSLNPGFFILQALSYIWCSFLYRAGHVKRSHSLSISKLYIFMRQQSIESKPSHLKEDFKQKLLREMQQEYKSYKTTDQHTYISRFSQRSTKDYNKLLKKECEQKAEKFYNLINQEQSSQQDISQIKMIELMPDTCLIGNKHLALSKEGFQYKKTNPSEREPVGPDIELFKKVYQGQLSKDNQIVVNLQQQEQESIIQTVQKGDVIDFLRKRQLGMGTLRKCLRNSVRLQIMHSSFIDEIYEICSKTNKIDEFQSQFRAIKEHKSILEQDLQVLFPEQKEEILRKYSLSNSLPKNKSFKTSKFSQNPKKQ